MMDKKLLNTLQKGERLVEMNECKVRSLNVFKVTVYTCVRIGLFGNKKINTYTFPFYFVSKELAQEFLQYYDKLTCESTIYWNDGEQHCFSLKVNGLKKPVYEYVLVDHFKKYFLSNSNDKKCQLTYNGIWGGEVNNDSRYFTFGRNTFYYTKIFEIESVEEKIDNTYIFKMIDNNEK